MLQRRWQLHRGFALATSQPGDDGQLVVIVQTPHERGEQLLVATVAARILSGHLPVEDDLALAVAEA